MKRELWRNYGGLLKFPQCGLFTLYNKIWK
jgi:hypothetical protein